MGLNNYLIVEERIDSDRYEQVHIAFSYGEVRELFYRVGDRILPDRDVELAGFTVVPGLAAVERADTINNFIEIYYRIIAIDGYIISYYRTTLEDYENLVGNSNRDPFFT